MFVEECLVCVMKVKLEMCLFNMGSINFVMFFLVLCYKMWKYSWEEDYV